MTGAHLSVTPPTIAARTDALAAVHADEVANESTTNPAEEGDEPDESPPEAMGVSMEGSGADQRSTESAADPTALTEEELLERARNAANGAKFARLWRGDTSGYPSHSEADMALCCLLAFWTGGDAQQMDRLFRESGLMRAKWDEVHYADGRTYGEVTIERALEVTDERYEPPADGRGENETGGPERSDGMATEGAVENPGDADVDAVRDRSRAHLVERNRLLRRRVEEQAARIEALEAALDRQSREGSDGESSAESPPVDDREAAISVRKRVQRWLTRGFSGE